MANELVPQDVWPTRLPSLLGDDFWPQFMNVNQSGLSLSEDDSHVYVEAALPGLEVGDVNISLNQGVLTISGEKSTEDKGKRHYQKMQSSYSYQVSLPSLVQEDAEPNAVLKNGILKVEFEKTSEPQPKKITIKSE